MPTPRLVRVPPTSGVPEARYCSDSATYLIRSDCLSGEAARGLEAVVRRMAAGRWEPAPCAQINVSVSCRRSQDLPRSVPVFVVDQPGRVDVLFRPEHATPAGARAMEWALRCAAARWRVVA